MYIWCNLAVFLPSWTSWNLHEKNLAAFGTLDGCHEVFLLRYCWCFTVCWFEWMQNYFLYYMCMLYVHIHHIASIFLFNRRSGRSCDNKRFQMGCVAADRFGLGFLPKWWRPLEFSCCFATWMKRDLKQRIVFMMIHVNDFLRPRGKVWST